ncbi:MAG: fatty acid desaturase [Planctomycetes bacterium]|nr:fatty acid desaturase [Planctomycetota bacterium]
MSLEILTDSRVRSVPWRDLTRLTRLEILKEIILPLPWLGLSLVLALWRLYPLALTASFVFFLAGLRQVHNAFHGALGVSRTACDSLLFVLSVLMLGSMHVVQFHHLRHHRHCMDDEDMEAMSARMSAWKAILLGPLFPLNLHRTALQRARPSQFRWIRAELLANLAWVLIVFAILDLPALHYHVVAMAAGQCLTAFFCVWTVHHDCDRSRFIARTLRRPWMNPLTLHMFYHVEHHLFPQVPTCHLPELARRLDRSAPELQQMSVF